MIVLGKIEKMNSLTDWERELALLENKSNLRKLPVIRHLGKEVEVNGKVMLNLSSNDYLGPRMDDLPSTPMLQIPDGS